MAKNKNNQAKNNSNKNNQKFRLKEQNVPTADKSADPPQPQGKNENKEF